MPDSPWRFGATTSFASPKQNATAALLTPAIRVRRDGVGSLMVPVDPSRIAQILANVADNARRHTPEGGAITIDVRRGKAGPELTITDTGPGVSGDQREQIFERLVRPDEARARDYGGAGLGLPITRALARAHGGELSCLAPDSGARLRLWLPSSVGPSPHRQPG